MGKAISGAVRSGLAVATGGLSEAFRKKDKGGVGGIDPQKSKFEQDMRAKAFQTPDSGRQAGFARESRKEMEQQAAQRVQQGQQARAQQDAFIQRLQAQAAGTAQSDAQAAIQDAARRQSANIAAQLASRRGFAGGASARAAARGQAAAQQQAAQQSAVARQQEQLAAQQQLAQQLTQQRQADLSAQQAAARTQLAGQQQELQLSEQAQQAAAQGAIAATERNLAEQGTRLQRDIANIQRKNAQSGALGSAIGTGLGAALGGPTGAQVGGSLGGFLSFNKGGEVPKMSKKEEFGFKKAIEAEKAQEKQKSGKQMKSQGGTAEPVKIENKPKTIEGMIERSSQLIDAPERQEAAKAQVAASQARAAEQATNAASARAAQQSLAEQLANRDASALTRAQTKASSEKSLAQQLAAAGRSRRTVSPAQQLAASQAAGAQLIPNVAQQALQEQQQVQGLTGDLMQRQRTQDLQGEDFARQLALQQLVQEAAVRESQRKLFEQETALDIDRVAAEQALAAQRANAPKRERFLGIFNQGGTVPGKAKVKGDSEKNDTVPALLSPGEIVIPRTVVDKGEEAMMGFIKGIQKMSKGGKKKSNQKNYFNGGMTGYDFSSQFKDPNALKRASILGQDTDMTGSEFTNQAAAQGNTEALESAGAKTGSGFAFGADEANIAQQGLGIIGALEKDKEKQKQQDMKQAQLDFQQALRNIKSMRKFSKGGKVSKSTYGDMISAKKELEKKMKELTKKGY